MVHRGLPRLRLNHIEHGSDCKGDLVLRLDQHEHQLFSYVDAVVSDILLLFNRLQLSLPRAPFLFYIDEKLTNRNLLTLCAGAHHLKHIVLIFVSVQERLE